jgi:predicted nucleic acid-binding protein
LISLDTNILVYATDENGGARHRAAADIVRDAKNVPVALTEQSVIEFVNVVMRKAGRPLTDVVPYVRELLASFVLIRPTRTIIEDVFALLEAHKLSVFDARIIAVCNAHGCDHLLSEDLQDGAQYGGVTVVNPFNPTNAKLIGRLLS